MWNELRIKRFFDVLVVSVTAPLSLPIILICAFLIKLKLGSPVLFEQKRPGLHGSPFVLYKFRTMTNERDSNGDLLPDNQRLKQFGLFLRSTSLDELPELWNVLKGDMSLVGPRPLLMEYLPLYSDDQKKRHHVLPGITGWAQINGRNELSWTEKFKLDVWYIENWSLWFDVKILGLTVKKVLSREAVSSKGQATVAKFSGNDF
jgi:sugar transferase EpsL